MKTLIKHSLIVAVLFSTLTSYASGVGPLVRVEGKKEKTFILQMNDAESQQVRILIKDDNGVVLYNEEVDMTKELFKKYDLKALPVGDYSLEVEDKVAIKVLPFEVNDSSVVFSKNEENQIFKPFLRQRGMMVDAMFMSLNDNATKISIYDQQGTLLENQKLPAGENVEKVLDFSNLSEGTYRISFQSGDRYFTQDVNVSNN